MRRLLLLAVLATPVSAQVEKVAMRTTGISCGVCAGLSEIYFRRMPGVQKVDISLKNEAILLTYKSGAKFDPAAIRKLLDSMQVGVKQFQISARGRIREQNGQRMFVAGKDTFLVTNDPGIAPETPVAIEAILNDHAQPMEVRILNSKPAP